MVSKMFYCTTPADEFIFRQGDDASVFFVISSINIFIQAKGKVAIEIKEEIIKILVEGNNFGELAILYNCPRSASARAIGECRFWGIDRAAFRRIIMELSEARYKTNRSILNEIPFMSSFPNIKSENFTQSQIDTLAYAVINEIYLPNQYIVKEGELAASFYMINEVEFVLNLGNCLCFARGRSY